MNARHQQQRVQAGRAARRARREAERAAAKHVVRRVMPWWQSPPVVGGLATVLIIAGIILFAVIRSESLRVTTHRATEPALTVPGDLHAQTNLIAPGRSAPPFTLHSVNGGTYSLAAQRGHPVLLEFFAVWCPHCQHEAPIIEKIKQHFGSQGLRIWSILANPYGPNYDISYGTDTALAVRSDLTWFRRTFGEDVPQLVNPNFSVVNRYEAGAYPTIYLIDGKGIVRYAQSGEQPYTQLAAAIQRVMKSGGTS